MWDLRAGRLLSELRQHTAPVTEVEFHPHEFLLASGAADRRVLFWDLENFSLVSDSQPETNAIRSVPCFDSLFNTVEFGYIIHGIYHPAANIGHFRPEPNFYIVKPPDISSSPPVISATLRGARGNICALRAAQIALIAGVAV